MAYAAFTLSDRSDWRLPSWVFRAWRAEGDARALRPVARPASLEPLSAHQRAFLAELAAFD